MATGVDFRRTPLLEAAMVFKDDAKIDTSQVEDVRGSSRIPGGRMTMGGGGLGLIATIVIILLQSGVLGGGGGDLGSLSGLDNIAVGTPAADNSELASSCRTGADANANDDCRVVGYVNSVQAYWSSQFARAGESYEKAKTRFFSGSVASGCGLATSESGPFYCPADGYVYIDLGFFSDLQTKFGARGGPTAQAYVIAHEYGHHIQDLLGILGRGTNEQGATGQSVRTELQADCFAGVWASHAVDTGYLEPLSKSAIADALDAAAAVGDDRIQAEYQGEITPDTWTHGSSEQRQRWFSTGYESGSPSSCDTSGAI
jgi:predicted metalloprotease